MPAWLVQLLTTLALQFGIPWLTEKFSWLPKEFFVMLQDILKYVQAADDKKEAVKTVRSQLGCVGIGCPPDLKGNI